MTSDHFLRRLLEAQTCASLSCCSTSPPDGSPPVLMENGGEATANLLNPDLTHIIVHAEIPDRYELLIRKTTECVPYELACEGLPVADLGPGRPRYRKLVTHDWVEASVDHGESDVLDEHDYKP